MKAYSYDYNGFYNGEITCQINPVATKREGKNVYLLPANSVLECPPEPKPNMIIKYDNGNWVEVESIVGKTIYKIGTTETDEVEFEGELEKGWTLEPTPEFLKAEAIQEAKASKAMQVYELKVTVDGMEFDADEISQGRMARAVAASESPLETTLWKLADNTVAEVTAAQLKQALRLAGIAQTQIWMT